MSNLSELLPAGAGAKSASFVATGNLASGQAVALKADGTVGVISGSAAGFGTAVAFENANTSYISATFDSNSNKVVVAYTDFTNSEYGTAIVGTVSGTSISFGTAVVFSASATYYSSATFDSTNNKIVIAYQNYGNSQYGTAIVGTVSGTSISFGTAAVFNSYGSHHNSATYNSTNNKVVIVYQNGPNNYGSANVATVSGTSISFGSQGTFKSAYSAFITSTYDSTNNKVVVAFQDGGNSYNPAAVVGYVSSTSIFFGTAVVFDTGSSTYYSATFDSTNSKVVIAYADGGNSQYGTAIVGTVSGTSTITFGTPVVFESANTDDISATFDVTNNKVVIAYQDHAGSEYGTVVLGTVSGTSISFGSPSIFAELAASYISATYDSVNNKVVIGYQNTSNANYGTAIVYQVGDVTNSADFVGITDEAIANTASGSVIVQGGVITNTGLISLGPVVGAESVFDSDTTYLTATVYDSNSNKIVVTYSDGGNSSYGTAVVGTVSGTSISFGTPVVFYSGALDGLSMVFDSSNNKVVAAYRAGSNSYHGYGVVGTVSGTSISFGTAVAFENANTSYISATFDSNLNKVVIAYQDNGNSGHGTAIVGTVSGTSISFGTAVVFSASATYYSSATFDSNSNKAVIAYRDNGSGVGGLGTAIVGTVSGTSISFGTAAVYSGSSAVSDQGITFDSSSNKVVVVYLDGGNSSYGTAVVGTVSGTAISFGTAVVYQASGSYYNAATFDSNLNKVIIAYRRSSPNEGNVSVGTVSGTSISFGNAATFNAANTAYTSMAFDTTNNKTVIAYRDSGDGNKGTSVVINLTSNLAIGTDYYVQLDGTISTTTSTAPAGRALSTTSMLLEG